LNLTYFATFYGRKPKATAARIYETLKRQANISSLPLVMKERLVHLFEMALSRYNARSCERTTYILKEVKLLAIECMGRSLNEK
jgi:hypothetical protein